MADQANEGWKLQVHVKEECAPGRCGGLGGVCYLHPCSSPPIPQTQGLVSLDWSFRQVGVRVKWKKIWWEPLWMAMVGGGAALKPRGLVMGSGPHAPPACLGTRAKVSGGSEWGEGLGIRVGLGWVQLGTGLAPSLCLTLQDNRCAPQRPGPGHRKAAAASTSCSCQTGWPDGR